jgi:hypothetical protein
LVKVSTKISCPKFRGQRMLCNLCICYFRVYSDHETNNHQH